MSVVAMAARRINILVGHTGQAGQSRLQQNPASAVQEEGPLVRLELGSDGVAQMTLCRAKKLNSLSLGMIRELDQRFAEVRSADCRCVLLRGEGKAFCAGGDVAACREGILQGTRVPSEFFFEEYKLIHDIAMLQERDGIVQVALWDGIVMGGGVGLSAHSPIRIATERTVFAMPETGIGLFPDVGMTWLLSRLKGGEAVGFYLGITGDRLGAADCLHAGLATHYCPSEKLPSVEAALRKLGREACGSIEAVLAAIEQVVGGLQPDGSKAFLAANKAAIESCFGGAAASVEESVKRLGAESSAWAKATLATMHQRSPLAMKVTLAAMQRHKATTLREALIYEYRISQWCMRQQPLSDFCEGIRAVLVDKDHKACWQPTRLEEVSEIAVEGFFAPLPIDHPCGELSV